MTASTTNKTIFIINPNTKEAYELFDYAKHFCIDIDYDTFTKLNEEGTQIGSSYLMTEFKPIILFAPL
jgi:hypothetical protein